ncbi:ceramide glucosyltransferase-like [Penaeus indicus]|uniref:ceramide glucosyltransferase-like n=1 Tax=Penaeus indicus TaxID=29960 RepID=UPI00300C6626
MRQPRRNSDRPNSAVLARGRLRENWTSRVLVVCTAFCCTLITSVTLAVQIRCDVLESFRCISQNNNNTSGGGDDTGYTTTNTMHRCSCMTSQRAHKTQHCISTCSTVHLTRHVFRIVVLTAPSLSLSCRYRKLHRRRALPMDGEPGVMGVSILKPLVGTPMDPNLMTNLETFFTLNYPKFELLFCIQEEGDPSIMIVQQLMKKHPHVDASYFIGGVEVGVNPKINNMQPGYLAAKHELVLVSDSGLLMKEDTLTDMVAHMTPDVGIVHQMPFTCDRKGWPAILEKVYFGTSHARMYLFLGLLDAFGLRVNCCTGMSCLMRKKVLDEDGGISAFGVYLAEDYFFAKYIQGRGWGIRISSQPACQNAGTTRVKGFLSRLTRWCKLRIAMVPHTLFLEPLSECMVLGLIASWAGAVLLRADYLTFFLFHTLTWSLADWIMLNIVQNGPPPFSKFEFVISWLFREISAIFIFVHAVWNPVISWRHKSFKLRWGGIAEPVNTKVAVM